MSKCEFKRLILSKCLILITGATGYPRMEVVTPTMDNSTNSSRLNKCTNNSKVSNPNIVLTSVTRFSENSPLWQQKLSLWQFFEGLFTIAQNFKPTLAIFYAIGQIFIVVPKQPNIEKIFPSGHSGLDQVWSLICDHKPY